MRIEKQAPGGDGLAYILVSFATFSVTSFSKDIVTR